MVSSSLIRRFLLGFVSLAGVLLLVAVCTPFGSTPAQAEMEKLEDSSLGEVTGEGGLGVRLNLRFEVGSGWENPNDNGEGSGDLRIEDDDGTGGGNTGWLYLQHIFGTITPQNSGDNVIHIDANPDVIQFSQGGSFTGINLSIGDIAVQTSSTGCCDDELASITIGNNASDADNDYVDGQGSLDFHNTKLKIF